MPQPGANDHLADQLEELAALLRIAKTDRFRVRAYERAAQVVRALPVDLTGLTAQEIARLEGVGPAIAGLIGEHFSSSERCIGMLESLRAEHPPGFGTLLRLPLIGVRDARALAQHGFRSIAELQAAGETGALAELDPRLAARVPESLRRYALADDGRLPMPLARRRSQELAASFASIAGVGDVLVAGSARRAQDTVGTFRFVLICTDHAGVAAALAGNRTVVRVLEDLPQRMTVVTAAGRCAELFLVEPEGAGAALLIATGPSGHVEAVSRRATERGMELVLGGVQRDGEVVAGATEADVYEVLGLAYVPPELRDTADAVDAAGAGAIPALLTVGDLRGDLHVHTDWSGDGKASLEEMVAAAAARGYSYVALTDHAENLKINGMSRDTVRRRRAAIARLQEQHRDLRLLDSAELNIGLDGSIDYDLEFLLEFDIGVASIHSHMDRLTPVQTDRILAAIANPAVHVIGHLTGRILGHRPAYGVEITAIAQAAAETGTALEVNGSPRRLDLNGAMVTAAIEAGALLSTSSDAHSVAELDYVENAVPTARRGWATAESVLNCRPLEEVLAFVQRKKASAS